MTTGPVMHASKLPLAIWFWAAYLMATHSNGIATITVAAYCLTAECSQAIDFASPSLLPLPHRSLPKQSPHPFFFFEYVIHGWTHTA